MKTIGILILAFIVCVLVGALTLTVAILLIVGIVWVIEHLNASILGYMAGVCVCALVGVAMIGDYLIEKFG